ncbi:hypothetical protein GO013_16065 [Pseudodesulfovibrio sp. JC047]|uniref:hypothetical protein n=1 Tax=Pseudodesulfovibrio sp. JC047 TaxID=2683199 RepID=UPI0013D07DA6|nr:hypothetical protein [Pseudodesulfovibrio sp. JC047]NDV20927.1 hypothetical protein [Pseudodesulfovibrio sp. JC047]
MSLTADRNTNMRDGELFKFPVAAAVIIFAGSMVALNADGNLVPATATAALEIVGRAEEAVDNRNGVAGDLDCETRRGCFCYANSSGGDEITRADINATAYVVDDETLAKTDGTGSRPAAGTIMDVDDLGVWVKI